jgi:hypothetical protein
MKRYDPRLIVCPHCRAPVGAWCSLLLGEGLRTRKTTPVVGFVHRERSRAAHRFRRAGQAPAGQLPLFMAEQWKE